MFKYTQKVLLTHKIYSSKCNEVNVTLLLTSAYNLNNFKIHVWGMTVYNLCFKEKQIIF